MLKLYTKLKIFKNSTNTNSFDLLNMEATSYRHWTYLRIIPEIGLVFNNTYYSSTTNKHQRDTMTLLDKLGIKIDMCIYKSSKNLYNLSGIIDDLETEIRHLKRLVEKPKTHKDKNKERIKEIDTLNIQIGKLKKALVLKTLTDGE
jgi:hypothetical protein